ncbi:MAG: hypothetical protein RIQ52_1952 [Pseudomonadota bacterium]
MLVDFIYLLPTWALTLCTITIFCCIGVGGLVVSRSFLYAKCRLSSETNEAVNGFISGVGVLYGLLLGLVAVANWNNFNDVERYVSEEVAAIATFNRDISALRSPTNSLLQKQILVYLDAIVNREWPAHQHGLAPNECGLAMDELHHTLTIYEPDSAGQGIIFTQAIDSYNQMIVKRQIRIDSVYNEKIPSVFWNVMIAGALLSILLSYFLHMPSLLTHAILEMIYCIFLGVMFSLIAALDNPFKGDISVKPYNYEHLLESLS